MAGRRHPRHAEVRLICSASPPRLKAGGVAGYHGCAFTSANRQPSQPSCATPCLHAFAHPMVPRVDPTPPQPSGDAMQRMVVASLLANLFEAGWSIQVLLGDMDRRQYEASRLARPEIERHLQTLADSAAALPDAVRAQMPRVRWADWAGVANLLPPRDEAARARVWQVLSEWLPPAGAELRRCRARLPEVWSFRL